MAMKFYWPVVMCVSCCSWLAAFCRHCVYCTMSCHIGMTLVVQDNATDENTNGAKYLEYQEVSPPHPSQAVFKNPAIHLNFQCAHCSLHCNPIDFI